MNDGYVAVTRKRHSLGERQQTLHNRRTTTVFWTPQTANTDLTGSQNKKRSNGALFSLHSKQRWKLSFHSTVTLLARLRGLSTSVPRATAVW